MELSGTLITESAYTLELSEQLTCVTFNQVNLSGQWGQVVVYLILVLIAWTIELDAFQLTGIRDRDRESIATGNYY